MALRLSQAVVNNLAEGMGWGDIIKNSICVVYSGSQPATPDLAATAGTELVRFTLGSAAATTEIRAAAKITLTGATGNVTALTVGGTALFTYSNLPVFSTVAALVTSCIQQVNATWTYPDFYAIPSGTTVGTVTYGVVDTASFWLIAPKNSGVSLATMAITATVASGTAPVINAGSSTTMGGAGGVAGGAPANCLTMVYPPTAGLITNSGTWSGTASATGTAGWFRLLCTPNYDTGLTNLSLTNDDSRLQMRIDGAVGTSGTEMIVTSTAIVATVAQSVTQFSLQVPNQ